MQSGLKNIDLAIVLSVASPGILLEVGPTSNSLKQMEGVQQPGY